MEGVEKPRAWGLSSRVPPRTIGMTWGVPKGPFNGPRKGGCRRVRRSEDWGAGFEGRGQTALGELFPETLRSPARFLRPPHRISQEKAPQQFFSSRLCSFLSRRGDPRTACSEGGHTSQHPASVAASLGGERLHPPLSGAPVLRERLSLAPLDPLVTLPVEWDENLGRIVLQRARTEFCLISVCILLFIMS